MKFYKITPGMTLKQVVSLVGNPESIDKERDGEGSVDVWRYSYPKRLLKSNAIGAIGRGGPTRNQKAIFEKELASQRNRLAPRNIVFKDGVVQAIHRAEEHS